MRSQRATRHHYLGRLILATMATAIAISLGLTAFGTPVPASAAESEVAASGANQSGSAELTTSRRLTPSSKPPMLLNKQTILNRQPLSEVGRMRLRTQQDLPISQPSLSFP